MAEALKGRVAIIVGASSGMGRATATLLAQAGAGVMLAARRKAQLEQHCRELIQQGGSAAFCAADAANREDVEQLVGQTVEKFGRVDLLVYAAGTNIPDRALDVLTPETWETMLATNLTGAFLCTKGVVPAMREQGGGLIVYLSSAAVQMPDVSGVAYQASKHGMAGLAHGTRMEEKGHGIRTTVIYPGLCDTEILQKRPILTPREVLDRALDPHDVAEAVLFVARLHPRAVVPEMQMLPSRL